MAKARNWISRNKFFSFAVVIVVVLFFSNPIIALIETRARMSKFRDAGKPGTGTNEIVQLFGKPSAVIVPGDSSPLAKGVFDSHPITENTIVLVYSVNGVQAFYFVDNQTGKITKSVVDSLW